MVQSSNGKYCILVEDPFPLALEVTSLCDMGIVLKWPSYGSLYLGSDQNLVPFVNCHLRNSELGQLP